MSSPYDSRPILGTVHQIKNLVLRAEYIHEERRVPITPEQLANLTHDLPVVLESSNQRIFSDQEYQNSIAAFGNSKNFTLCPELKLNDTQSSLILGLKTLEKNFELGKNNIHIYFAHAYKNQKKSSEILASFSLSHLTKTPSILLDHEYCLNEHKVRTHAFGYSAGFATSAMALWHWYHKINHQAYQPQSYYPCKDQFFNALKLQLALFENIRSPYILILGSSRGNSANGSMAFIKELNSYLVEPIQYQLWGREETKSYQDANPLYGLQSINQFDMVINATFTDQACAPFITDLTLANIQKSFIIADVTCDDAPHSNRIRLHDYMITDFDAPFAKINAYVDLISVDHSPSFFPKESSIAFANQFFPVLKSLIKTVIIKKDLTIEWRNSANVFYKQIENVFLLQNQILNRHMIQYKNQKNHQNLHDIQTSIQKEDEELCVKYYMTKEIFNQHVEIIFNYLQQIKSMDEMPA